jgi:serine/threonine-protein kinase
LDRIVALKVLSKRLTESPEFVSRFQREVRSVGKLSHPNIVVAFRSGECDGQPWLAMEFVDGESLRAMMRHAGPLPQVDTVRCFRDIARALAHAHASNLIHRDVKPDNILIAKDGTAKLADLGLAKSVQDDEKLTATGIALGTPHYISPEQACGLKDADFRSDLYSLGASMFHALVGRPVFPAENKSEVMRHHVQTPPPDPRSLRADLTPELCAVILKLLSKKPEERYASAADVADDLDRILRGNPPKHAHVAAPSPAAEEAAPKRGRRPAAKRAKTRSGCLVLIIALLTIGWRLAEWLEKIIAT